MYLKLPIAITLAISSTVCFALQESTMETLVVTGTYSPIPKSRITSSLSVLDGEQLRALNKKNLAQALNTISGVSVESQGGPGGLSAVSIRGGESNFTLVMIDGIPQNDPTNSRGGSFDFSTIDPVDVEKIEVIRGPQSVVYGSDALAGVINIITREATEKSIQQIRAEWGQNDLVNLNFNASGGYKSMDYVIGLANNDAGEPTEGSTRKSKNANMKIGWKLDDIQELNLSYRYSDGERTSYPEQGGGPELSLSDALDESHYSEKTLALGWQIDLSDTWKSSLHASRFKHDEEYYSPGIVPFDSVPPNSADTNYRRDKIQWINKLTMGSGYQLDVGAEYRHEQGQSEGSLDFGFFELPTTFELDRANTALFASLHTSVTDLISVQAGVRYDDSEGFGSETSLSLGASYHVTPELILSSNWGEAFKLPSFFALGHSLVGNPDLDPETAQSWDISLAWKMSQSSSVSASYFFNDYRNLIDFDPEDFTNVNRSQVESNGGEFSFDFSVTNQVNLQAHATYINTDIKDEVSVLLGRPRWQAGALLQWDISGKWTAVIDYQWKGEQYAASLYSGESVTETLQAYQLVDWNMHFQINPSLRLEVAVDNLLDENYQNAVGFYAEGRTGRIAITADGFF